MADNTRHLSSNAKLELINRRLFRLTILLETVSEATVLFLASQKKISRMKAKAEMMKLYEQCEWREHNRGLEEAIESILPKKPKSNKSNN